MKKIKIIFSSSNGPNLFFLSPIHWFLKLYHENFGKSKNQYFWTLPDIIFDNNDLEQEELIEKIQNENIDIVAISMYSWNRKATLNLCKKLKQLNSNIVTVVGGPDVDSHKNNEFVKNHPYIDYSIYGDGEVAFSRLLDMISGFNVDLVNLVDNLGNIYPHEVFLDKNALKKSPYIEYQEEFVEFFLNLQNYITTSISKETSVVIVWETTKGCPYACSFCDWSSGLHNKVRIWGINSGTIPNWQKEIELFFKLDKLLKLRNLGVYWTNPNIGLARQDEEIIDYWANLRKQLKKGPIIQNPQLSKLRKDITFRILDKMIDSGITKAFKFDLQDLDTNVLEKINRPEIPWEEHKKYILDLKSKHQYLENLLIRQRITYNNRITFIWGLPGQTIEHLKFNIIEAGIVRCFGHNLPFELLPNSPAYNKEYIEKFKIKFKKIEILDQNSLSKIKSNITTCIEKAVTETYSLSEYEYFKGIILYNIYSFFYSDYYKPIFGLEYKIFDNSYKIEEIIKKSYNIFLETEKIGIVDEHNQLLSVSDYFFKNKEKVYNIFEFKKTN